MDKRTERLLLVAAFAGAALIGGCNKPGQPLLPMPAASTATGNVADIDVTENVKTALQRNDLLKAFDIGVVTLKGDVLNEIDVLGKMPSNLCFGGEDGKTVYVTEVEHKRVVSFRVDHSGREWSLWKDGKP